VKEHPGVLQYAVNLWQSSFNLANLEREEGRLQAAVSWSSRAIDALGGDLRGKLDAFARGYLSDAYRCRALALARMDRHAEAVEDWDEALALNDGSRRHVLLLERGLSLSQLGEHARAVGDAEEGIRSDNPTAEAHYAAAQIHAISADKVQRDTPGERTTHMTLARRNGLALKYADRAMALLMQAVRSGYKDGTKLRTDKALDSLRARDDFQGLLQELDAAPE
jgi:tetratricopeptide (TPR) repeat protein